MMEVGEIVTPRLESIVFSSFSNQILGKLKGSAVDFRHSKHPNANLPAMKEGFETFPFCSISCVFSYRGKVYFFLFFGSVRNLQLHVFSLSFLLAPGAIAP